MNPTTNDTASLQAIRFVPPQELSILDQLLLPFETVYRPICNIQDGHHAIKIMQVRGAPAIAIVAVLSLVVDFHSQPLRFDSPTTLLKALAEAVTYLQSSRPTAVNLFEATTRLQREMETLVNPPAGTTPTVQGLLDHLLQFGKAMLAKDVEDNRRIGEIGADVIQKLKQRDSTEHYKVVTHCNTGALATAGWGTALGIVRSLHKRLSNQLHVYCTETRPYMQGSRLTAYELVHEGIPSTLVTDSMVSALLKLHSVDAIVVGADRVAANGDTANKIGTYQLAVTAHHHRVPFIVAAPLTSVDLNLASGDVIVIEERPSQELLSVTGRATPLQVGSETNSTTGSSLLPCRMPLAAPGISAWNPSFDVTPAHLIDYIVTEIGAIPKNSNGTFDIQNFITTSKTSAFRP
ncbi:S-methyl-5-thioribose-1-phosphate isomerase [Dispira simplex]|nr:S-methyl-5-thioribose-1-phosphate isomerase [Dispira simplex]